MFRFISEHSLTSLKTRLRLGCLRREHAWPLLQTIRSLRGRCHITGRRDRLATCLRLHHDGADA